MRGFEPKLLTCQCSLLSLRDLNSTFLMWIFSSFCCSSGLSGKRKDVFSPFLHPLLVSFLLSPFVLLNHNSSIHFSEPDLCATLCCVELLDALIVNVASMGGGGNERSNQAASNGRASQRQGACLVRALTGQLLFRR